MRIFVNSFDLPSVLRDVRARGYVFVSDALESGVCRAMAEEAAALVLESGDHVAYPINKGTRQEVRQLHERVYRPIGHEEVLVATEMCRSLAREVSFLTHVHPELIGWMPTEIGYQRYRDANDWISPHRDRSSDRLLSVTFTISGSALMRIYESDVDPPDYNHLRLVDEFLTAPGTVMFLRASGFGSGQHVIHEVLPPTSGSRLILNLRMRPTILKPPKETRWR